MDKMDAAQRRRLKILAAGEKRLSKLTSSFAQVETFFFLFLVLFFWSPFITFASVLLLFWFSFLFFLSFFFFSFFSFFFFFFFLFISFLFLFLTQPTEASEAIEDDTTPSRSHGRREEEEEALAAAARELNKKLAENEESSSSADLRPQETQAPTVAVAQESTTTVTGTKPHVAGCSMEILSSLKILYVIQAIDTAILNIFQDMRQLPQRIGCPRQSLTTICWPFLPQL